MEKGIEMNISESGQQSSFSVFLLNYTFFHRGFASQIKLRGINDSLGHLQFLVTSTMVKFCLAVITKLHKLVI